MNETETNGWMTVTDYARAHKVSSQSVYKRVQHNSLDVKTIDGKKYVREVESAPEPTASGEPTGQLSIAQQYALARLQNLKAETELKTQRIQSQKEALKREICEAVYNAYSEAFADFKSELIALHLTAEQTASLHAVMSKCIHNFSAALKTYLSESEKEAENQEESDEHIIIDNRPD